MRWVPTVCVLCLVGWSATTSAQALELQWQAPQACPDRAQVQAQVEHLLGRAAAAADWVAEARIARKGERWILKLNLQHAGRRATRTLQADDCVTLSDAAAWLIAVAIDPSVSAPAAASVTASTAGTEAAASGSTELSVANGEKSAGPVAVANGEKPASDQLPSSGAPASQQSIPTNDAGGTAVFAGGVFGGLSAAGLAGPAVSLGAQAELRLGALWLGLLLAHDFERTSTLLPSGVAAHFSSQELGLQLCMAWGSVLHFGPCMALSVRLTSASTSANEGRDNSALWATLGPCVQLTYDLFAQGELFLNAGLAVPFTKRPQFEVLQFGEIANAGRVREVGGALRLGVGMHWR
jgi:hypothetical protein